MSQEQPVPIFSEFADDPDMTELVEAFVSELPRRVTALAECLEQQQLSELQRLAHQLKGASGGYGFPTLGEAAGRVESMLKAGGGSETLRAGVEELISLCSRARCS